jgi:hypothetical protein
MALMQPNKSVIAYYHLLHSNFVNDANHITIIDNILFINGC